MRIVTLLLAAFFFITPARAQLSDSLLQVLKNERAKMYAASTSGDYTAFGQLMGDDYLTANADGSYGNKEQTLEQMKIHPLPKMDTLIFKEDTERIYGNTVFHNGRIQVYKSGMAVVDFLFTEAWIYRDNRWQFINWQGTYTGVSQHYEFIIAGLIAFVLILIFLVRYFMRRKKNA